MEGREDEILSLRFEVNSEFEIWFLDWTGRLSRGDINIGYYGGSRSTGNRLRGPNFGERTNYNRVNRNKMMISRNFKNRDFLHP